MRAGLGFLIAGYVLSQFYRAFLAVLAPVLNAELGATASDLARASGLWFLTFALMQIPVGIWLDRYGPRRVVALLLGIFGAGGAVVLAQATGPRGIDIAMALIGIGCAPVLMGAYFIYARVYPAAIFATLAGVTIGIGSLGNIAGSVPLAWVAGQFGWRGTVAGLALVTLAVAVAVWAVVRDPGPAPAAPPGSGTGGLADVLRMPGFWLMLPLVTVNYAPAAGLRGLWAGPFMRDVYGLDATGIGRVTLVMGIAMVIGNFAYGPLDRWLGTRKWVAVAGNALACACLAALWLAPGLGLVAVTLLLAGVGMFGASFPLLTAHGRSFFPPHLVGRGVTLINMFSIAGVGLMQVASGPLFRRIGAGGAAPETAYATLFGFFGLALAAGLVIYLCAPDRTD